MPLGFPVTVPVLWAAGAYAKVYRGTLSGDKVAVKVVKEPNEAIQQDGVPLEASLMQGRSPFRLQLPMCYWGCIPSHESLPVWC